MVFFFIFKISGNVLKINLFTVILYGVNSSQEIEGHCRKNTSMSFFTFYILTYVLLLSPLMPCLIFLKKAFFKKKNINTSGVQHVR